MSVALLLDHPARGLLGQEVRALQVHPDQLVEALLAGLEDVGAHLGGDAGVVHQHVEAAEGRADGLEEGGTVVGLRDVGADVHDVRAFFAQGVQSRGDVRPRPLAADGEIETFRGERPSRCRGRCPARRR